MLLCSSFSSEFISQDSLACHAPEDRHHGQLPQSPTDQTPGEGRPQGDSPSRNSSDGLHTSVQHVVGSETFPSQHCQKHSCGGENTWVTSRPFVCCSGLKGGLFPGKVPFHLETCFKYFVWQTFPQFLHYTFRWSHGTSYQLLLTLSTIHCLTPRDLDWSLTNSKRQGSKNHFEALRTLVCGIQ